jgi:hypothetical protein
VNSAIVGSREDAILGALRIALVHLWLYSLWDFRDLGLMPEGAWEPISLAFAFRRMPTAGFFDALYVAATGSALLLLAGAWTSVSGPATVAFGTVLACLAMSFGKVMHDLNGLVLVLFVLSFSNWGRGLSIDAWRARTNPLSPTSPAQVGWALWACAFALALPYASSAGLKIWNGQFLSPENFPRLLARFAVRVGERTEADLWLVEWLLARPTWAHGMAFVGVGLELGFCLGLLSRPLRIMAWAGAILLHCGISVLLGIHFRQHTMLCAYLLVAEAALALADRRRPAGASSPMRGAPSWPIVAVMMACLALAVLVEALPVDGGTARAGIELVHGTFLIRPPGPLPFVVALATAVIAAAWLALDLARRRSAAIRTRPERPNP